MLRLGNAALTSGIEKFPENSLKVEKSPHSTCFVFLIWLLQKTTYICNVSQVTAPKQGVAVTLHPSGHPSLICKVPR